MTLALLTCLALAVQIREVPVLRDGVILEEEITDGDPVVHTETLDRNYADAPVLGKIFRIEVEEAGTYTIELRSYLFDAYLVLRNEAGEILNQDDDGAVGRHARITRQLEAQAGYVLEACTVRGGRGPFELCLQSGEPSVPSPDQERAEELADLKRTVEVREHILGSEHLQTYSSLDNLARFHLRQCDYQAAIPLFERKLGISKTKYGPIGQRTAGDLFELGY